MKFFNFDKKENKPKINQTYDNFGGEFVDDNSWQFNPEYILESKENLPKFLYRGVKNKGSINNIDTALESLKKINNSEDSIVNWQTESMSTTEDINVAFGYALEGELANKLDIRFKDGSKVFKFLNQNMGRWLLDNYPEKLISISEIGEVNIDWEKAKIIALEILDEQTVISNRWLENNKISLGASIEKYSPKYGPSALEEDYGIKDLRKNIREGEERTAEENINKYKDLISKMNSENIEFRIDDEIKNATLGYLFELEPKEKVRVATRKSVDNFMKHHNINVVITPGIAKKGSSKELLTNLMKDAGYNGIDKNSSEKEIGFFNPEDLKPIFGLEIKIINGKLVTENHNLNK